MAKLKGKIETLRAQVQMLRMMEAQVGASPDGQVSLTDPDARAMATALNDLEAETLTDGGLAARRNQSALQGQP